MKGLEISRMFFEEWDLPYIRKQFPQIVDRVATGLFSGSQSIGADDEVSRDHAWGPGFKLILTDSDYSAIGETLSQQIFNDAPNEWKGWRSTFTESNRFSVESISDFFKRETESDYNEPPHPVPV